MVEKTSWQGWCPMDKAEVAVVAKGQGFRRGLRQGQPCCICTKSGECQFEEEAVKTAPPQKQGDSSTSQG